MFAAVTEFVSGGTFTSGDSSVVENDLLAPGYETDGNDIVIKDNMVAKNSKLL